MTNSGKRGYTRAPRHGRSHQPSARRRGQAVPEFAIIVPVILLLLVVAIDFGRIFFSYVQINNASREGAAAGITAPQDTAAITAAARRETNAQGQTGEHPLIVTATCATSLGAPIACVDAQGGSGVGNTVTVKVDEAFSFMTPADWRLLQQQPEHLIVDDGDGPRCRREWREPGAVAMRRRRRFPPSPTPWSA